MIVERGDNEFHRHAQCQIFQPGIDNAGFDDRLSGQLDIAEQERRKYFGSAIGLLRLEILPGPRPQRTGPRQRVNLHIPRGIALGVGEHHLAAGQSATNQARLGLGGPQIGGNRLKGLGHTILSIATRSLGSRGTSSTGLFMTTDLRLSQEHSHETPSRAMSEFARARQPTGDGLAIVLVLFGLPEP